MIRFLLLFMCPLLLAHQTLANTIRGSVNLTSSSAQIRSVQKTHKGELDGVALFTSFDMGKDYALGLDVKVGSGKVFSGKSTNYSFNEYIAHTAFKFGGRSGSLTQLNYGFSAGLGILHKSANFDGLKFSETQYPIFLGVDFDITKRVSMRIKGYSQLNKFDDNRAAFIGIVLPLSDKVSIVGHYSNYSSKINEIKHCGSDYIIGLEMNF